MDEAEWRSTLGSENPPTLQCSGWILCPHERGGSTKVRVDAQGVPDFFADVFHGWPIRDHVPMTSAQRGGGGSRIAQFCGQTVLIGCVKCRQGEVKNPQNFADTYVHGPLRNLGHIVRD